ncbi:uncharacterized short protein YbdD (DUF466 family) [Tahibacter aquaticus]|uniref:Uncharacterized short protein YbdD (DUF466 family) n=1 Tax=Tahibacter aquaticus TaxID=520092 RepID=A0A4R6YTA2_9GAMM|nr:YbdD/YjiX family protein [Tahibacter aquaticus]TDR41619.1 uncharacterized short protein YbdD (DUF466 family) [Tahibacter aquaticus]
MNRAGAGPNRWLALARAGWRQLRETARLAVGVPDYGSYLRHARAQHPDVEPLSYEEFFANRLAARYGRGRSRCC